MNMTFEQSKAILKEAGLSVESDEDRFVRDTITKMVNDFPNKNRNKSLVHDPEKGKAVKEFIRNYYNSMPSIDDCIERLYAVIENGTL